MPRLYDIGQSANLERPKDRSLCRNFSGANAAVLLLAAADMRTVRLISTVVAILFSCLGEAAAGPIFVWDDRVKATAAVWVESLGEPGPITHDSEQGGFFFDGGTISADAFLEASGSHHSYAYLSPMLPGAREFEMRAGFSRDGCLSLDDPSVCAFSNSLEVTFLFSTPIEGQSLEYEAEFKVSTERHDITIYDLTAKQLVAHLTNGAARDYGPLLDLLPGHIYAFASSITIDSARGHGTEQSIDLFISARGSSDEDPAFFTPAPPVPEPSTMILIGTGIAGAVARRRRKHPVAEARLCPAEQA